jgi:hypothetical protein
MSNKSALAAANGSDLIVALFSRPYGAEKDIDKGDLVKGL